MENFLFYSYLVSTLTYSTLLIFALVQKQRNVTFVAATFCSTVWSISIVHTTFDSEFFLADTLIYETIRNVSWFVFCLNLLSRQLNTSVFRFFSQSRLMPLIVLLTIATVSIETFPNILDIIRLKTHSDPRFFAHVLFSITGLILIEQLYRNTPLNQRWHVKYICLGLGALFVVDLLVYSKSLLYKYLDVDLWQSRGLINAIVVPFLAISLPRLNTLEQSTFHTAPRKIVFYSTILFGTGIYLITMSAAGYYLKQTNAKWGESLQILFMFLALLLLAASFTSGKIRALVKVYFSKHFFHYNYDYREEWLKISKALAQLDSLNDLKHFIITTLTNLVDSSGGGLWLKTGNGEFFLAAQQNLRLNSAELKYLKNGQDLPNYLANKQWVIDFFELAHAPEVYEDIDLSPWCYEDSQVWLIVPLFHLNHLEAFVILTQPKVPRKLNWEDHDLLKTVGMQLANAIALNRTSEALASNKQFETYHRLAAYLVHDLKNITAQLSLIIKNADKHKGNPDFFDDTIDTVKNAVNKMQHIVDQLKQGKTSSSPVSRVELVRQTQQLLGQYKTPPIPQLETPLNQCTIMADSAKFNSVIANLIQNALDAVKNKNDGWVILRITTDDDYATIKIMDNGIGMNQTFIAERLFKPFDTTKGNAGMGIGAYEAKDFILKLGGQVTVDSKPGEGTIFTLQIPLTTPEEHEAH